MSFFKKLFGSATDSIDGRELVLAAQGGHKEVVESLLTKGADVNARSENGITALMAASHLGHTEVLMLLLAKGANIDDRDIDGATALMAASQNGHVEVVNALLDAGANITPEIRGGENVGVTALHLASKGCKEVVQALLDRGANADARLSNGETPLWIASGAGYDGVVQALLEKGADVNARRNDGVSALTHASIVGHTAVVQLLLTKGADVNSRAKNGATALMLASMNGHMAVVQLLLTKGADVNARGKNGAAALTFASKNGHMAVVQLLLNAGADVIADGAEAMRLASEMGHERVRTLLDAAVPAGAISFVLGKDDRKFHSLKYVGPGNVYGQVDVRESGWDHCHAVIVLAEAVSAWHEFGYEDYTYGFRVLDDDLLAIYVEFTTMPRPDRKFPFVLSLKDPGHYEWLAFLWNAKRLTIINGPEGSFITGLTLQLDSACEMKQLHLALARTRTNHPQ